MAGAKTTRLLAAALLSLSAAAVIAALYVKLLGEEAAPIAAPAPRRPSEGGYHIAVDPKLGAPTQTPAAERIALPKPKAKPKTAPKAAPRRDDAELGDLATETARLYGRWLKEYQAAATNRRLSPQEKQRLGQRYQQEFMPRFLELAADKKASMLAVLDLIEDPATENRAQVVQMLKSLANYPSESEVDMGEVNDRIFDLLEGSTEPELRSQLLMGLQVKTEVEQRRSLDLFLDITRNGQDEGLRAMALYKLARFEVAGAREQVSRVLADPSEPARVRVGAIQAIDFSQWPDGIGLFRELSQDPNSSVRQSVYSRAYQMKNSPELRQALQDALRQERDQALLSSLQYSLQIHGDEDTMRFLQNLARDDTLEAPRRAAAQQAYAVIKQRLAMAKAQEEARRGGR